ncbi:PREDICTED: squamous cell carcinoma antigen recognized by T-cells 3-like [Nelumbo nucifera]|uniref:Squamous cell carcinoma antigen recognized by T-cells 3-like n=1 Tax=Nelumbo nucifera TaxID=4432 RepID=A0A1U8B4M9_NELNU|nr:PREDICTED: squamous cell carcinoma antigen recognized by T-cells 3-like [Nelumbo nucifera]
MKDAEHLDDMNNLAETKSDTENPSSSDSESSDDDAEDLQLETLEKELAENPSSYDTHVQYIRTLRKLGLIENLREARESMNILFPLSPAMWREWAKDEASLNTGPEAFAVIEKLYERGVHEYLSVSLWCDYVNFVQEHDPSVRECSSDGIKKMRDLFERALTAGGLHLVEGNKIWEAYREFELNIFHTIDDNNNEGKEKQIQCIRSIFHRQLSVPLDDLRSTLLAYKAWEVKHGNLHESNCSDLDGIPSHVTSAYQKAMEMYNARIPYEQQISKQDAFDTEKLQHFTTYLKFEQSCGDPARIQLLYERAVAVFPISSDLWIEYTQYLDHTLKIPNVAKCVYSRATRNCTWIGELWVRYLLSLERAHASEEELSTVFEQSLQCSFSSIDEYLDLFLTRVDGLRRRISPTNAEDGLDCTVFRDTFQRAKEYISPHLKSTDDLLHLHAYWAHLELNLAKDLVAARGVWESLLKTSGSMLEAWQSYIRMEIEAGHIKDARSIYKRCYSKRFSGTGSEDICHSWLRFERKFGSLEDFDFAVRKVTPRLEELRLFRAQQESKNVSITTAKEIPADVVSQKRKSGRRLTDEQPQLKRQKYAAYHSEGALVKDTTKKSTEEDDAKPIDGKTNKLEPTDEQRINGSTSKKTKYTDQCTVFVSNLSFEAKEEHLRDFFSDVGGVTAIRILRNKFNGKSRGLAYVDFSDEIHLVAAVSKNKKQLLGKKLNIVRSDPKQSQKQDSSRSNTITEHGKRTTAGEDAPDEKHDIEGSVEADKESVAPHVPSSHSHRRGETVYPRGKSTSTMVPRAVVRPLGWGKNEPRSEGDEKPKSNDEFREMFLKTE